MGIVTLVADLTDHDPKLKEWLVRLKSPALPVLAIFPAGKVNQPIVINEGWYTKKSLTARLEQAGPSQSAASGAPTTVAASGG